MNFFWSTAVLYPNIILKKRGQSPSVHAGSPLAGVVPTITRMMDNVSVVNGGKFYRVIGEPLVKFARRAPIMAAGNLLDLVCMVLSPYRDILSDALRAAQKARWQHTGMVSQLSGLENHKRAGTTPSWLNVKPPTYQAVKGFISAKAEQGSDKPFANALKARARLASRSMSPPC